MPLTSLHLVVPTEARGGAEEFALRVAREARRRGWTVRASIPLLDGTATLQRDLRTAGVEVHLLPSIVAPTTSRAHASAILAARRCLRDARADATLLVLPSVLRGIPFLIAAGLDRRRVVAVFQLVHKEQRIPSVIRLACAWAFRRRQTWVAVSRGDAEALADKFGVSPGGVDVVYNAPPPFAPTQLGPDERIRAREAVLSSLKLGPATELVLTVAALRRTKGHDVLLDAIPRVLADHPHALFLWVGEGEERSTLERRIATAGLAHAVRLLGQQDAVLPFLLAADAFVLPTRREGMSFALLEAIQAGLPVVTTDASGILEIATEQEHVLVCRADDASALAQRIHETLASRSRAQARADQARSHLDWLTEERMLREHLGLLEGEDRKAAQPNR